MESKDYIEKMFYPKSIAMIEAAKNRTWQVLGITSMNFRGDLYVVSKKEDELLGIKCHKDISELPDKIDHAIIAVNRNRLKKIIESCVEKKFHTIHIFSAGAAEYDEKGAEIEREIYEILKDSDIRAIGPNCMGVYCPEGRISYNPRFSGKPDGLAFVSQSGDITSQYIFMMNNHEVYFSKAASIGNSIDLKIHDFVEYFSSDEKTEIISIYFEGFSRYDKGEGRKLQDVLRKNKKPLLLLRGGVTDQGKKAAASHTGTLAVDNRIWRTLYKQTSALEVNSYEELIDSTIA
ncbi:MAG: CoA-binding protein, partial [Promethearchaeota archaeon]